MKFCQSCGAEINENAVVCVKYGCSTETKNQASEVDDSVSTGLVILSCMIPIFGVIYWIAAAKSRPKCAKFCGIVGIVMFVVSFVMTSMIEGI